MVLSIHRDPSRIMKLLALALVLRLNCCVSALSIKSPAWTNTLVQQGDLDQPLPNVSKGPLETRIDFPIGRDPVTPSGVVSSVRYGPFPLPAGGMVSNELLYNVKKSCADCFIVAMQSRLEDANQNELNTDAGFWLHHAILFNSARPDLTCPAAGERFYGGGNTKATRRWNLFGRWGYRVHDSDSWYLVLDLMNEGDTNVEAVVRVDFEWVSASSEEGQQYREVRPIWLSLDDYFCGGIGVPVPSLTKPFRLRTPSWLSSVEGPILDVAAHVHDGGLDMATYLNGHEICRSAQLYGQGHIVGQGACKNVGRLKIADVLLAEVRYDPRERALVTHDGTPDRIMGTTGLCIGIE